MIAGVRNLVTLNPIVNGDNRQKPPEDNAAPKWAELCSGGHCPSIFTAESSSGKAALLLGTSGWIKPETAFYSCSEISKFSKVTEFALS